MSSQVDNATKHCTKCGQSKPLSEFYKNSYSPDGYKAACKDCICASRGQKRRVQPNPGMKFCSTCLRELPASTEFFDKHPAGTYGLNPVCRECRKQYNAHYRERNRERLNNYDHNRNGRTKTSEYRERMREYGRRYYAANKEQLRKQRQLWRSKHPESGSANNWRRRLTKKKNLPFTFTDVDITNAFSYWRWKCAYCGVDLAQLSLFDEVDKQLDHYIALSDPRSDNPGTVPANILPVCSACNRSKSNHNPIEWITRTFGVRKARTIIAAIEAYFIAVRK